MAQFRIVRKVFAHRVANMIYGGICWNTCFRRQGFISDLPWHEHAVVGWATVRQPPLPNNLIGEVTCIRMSKLNLNQGYSILPSHHLGLSATCARHPNHRQARKALIGHRHCGRQRSVAMRFHSNYSILPSHHLGPSATCARHPNHRQARKALIGHQHCGRQRSVAMRSTQTTPFSPATIWSRLPLVPDS